MAPVAPIALQGLLSLLGPVALVVPVVLVVPVALVSLSEALTSEGRRQSSIASQTMFSSEILVTSLMEGQIGRP